MESKEDIKETISKLTDEMLKYASEMEFEKAAELRDKIKELEKLLRMIGTRHFVRVNDRDTRFRSQKTMNDRDTPFRSQRQ